MYPSDLKYTTSHEWVKVEGDTIKIGITSFAITELTDLTFLQFEVEVGDAIDKGDNIAEVESVKTTSEVYTPVSGEIVELNEDLPEMLDDLMKDPYEIGWMMKIKLSDSSELDDLLSVEAYEKEAVSDH